MDRALARFIGDVFDIVADNILLLGIVGVMCFLFGPSLLVLLERRVLENLRRATERVVTGRVPGGRAGGSGLPWPLVAPPRRAPVVVLVVERVARREDARGARRRAEVPL